MWRNDCVTIEQENVAYGLAQAEIDACGKADVGFAVDDGGVGDGIEVFRDAVRTAVIYEYQPVWVVRVPDN